VCVYLCVIQFISPLYISKGEINWIKRNWR